MKRYRNTIKRTAKHYPNVAATVIGGAAILGLCAIAAITILYHYR